MAPTTKKTAVPPPAKTATDTVTKRDKETVTKADVGAMPDILAPTGPAVDADPTPKPAPKTYLQPVTASNVKQALADLPLPAFLESIGDLPEAGAKAEYLGFASTKSKQWLAMSQAGCQEGTPFAFANGQYHPFPQGMIGHLIDVRKFFTTMEGQEGKITRCTLEDLGIAKHDPHYLAFWLIRLPGGQLLPIRGDFRGTKSGGFEQAMQSLKLAATPEWLSFSDAHKISAVFPHPWGRVIHTITTSREVSKSTMNVYYKTNAMSKPSNMDDIAQLANALRDTEFQNKMNEQWVQFERRNSYYHSLIGK